ncbi:MAG TPA: amidohydrolase, partial [Lachnospiraceae bacterium]|nr:amidohydrolase [Lachnospiraceae bacterium]
IAGINAMRQQFGPDVKIHEVITNGGQSPNIIPEYASMWIFVRATDKNILEKAAERIVNIGKGASLMTGAQFRYKRAKNTFYDIKRNEKLNSLMKANLAELGITRLEEGDKYHCESTDIGNVSYRCPVCYTTLGTSHISDAGIHEQGFIDVAGSDEAKKLMHIAAKAMAMTALDVL